MVVAQIFIPSVPKPYMENENKFPEQEAPEKNTDKAFVQVGKDGEPVIPSTDETKTDIEKEGSATTLDQR